MPASTEHTEGDVDMLTLIAKVRHAVDDLEEAVRLGVHRNPHEYERRAD